MAELAYGRDWFFLGDEEEGGAATAGQRPAARVRPAARARPAEPRLGPRERATDRGAGTGGAFASAASRAAGSGAPGRAAGPSAPKTRGPRRGGAFERVLGLLIAAAALSLLGMAAFVFLPGLLRLDEIRVSGQVSMTEAEVLEASLLRGDERFLSVDPAAVERALLAEPRVAEARVERVFPNDLAISLRERVPVAAILVQSEGRDLLVQVDEEGVAFAVGGDAVGGEAVSGEALGGEAATASAAPDGGESGGAAAKPAATAGLSARGCLPVLSGLRFEGFSLGARLPPSFKPLLSSLARVAAAEPLLLEAFSELKVGRGSFGELELVLYPLHHRIPVRVGPDLNEATLRSIILVLDVLSSRLPAGSVEEIDFRSGKVTYRSKEGMSG